MTVECPEPPNGGRDPLQPSVYAQAYKGFLEGVVTSEIDVLRQGVNAIQQTDFPLAEVAARKGVRLERSILDGTVTSGLRRDTFETGLRSYVYSGVPFNPEHVKFVARMLQVEDRDLRRMVLPTDIMGALDCLQAPLPEERKAELRRFGHVAVQQLGMATPAVRLGIRLGLYR